MQIRNEEDILNDIRQDEWMMDVLNTAKELHLPDWCICAGFVRSKVWDSIHCFSERTPLPDVDIIYFDKINLNVAIEKEIEQKLYSIHPNVPWSVKNQARMHLKNNVAPYTSSTDAISKFPETATAVGIKLDHTDNLRLIAPWGINDLIHVNVKPTPLFQQTPQKMEIFKRRLENKRWHERWKGVKYDF